MEFPQYRRLSNKKSFYRIDSMERFVEVQIVGSKYFAHDIEAKQYPEMLRIREMLSFSLQDIELSDEAEFTSHLMHAITV